MDRKHFIRLFSSVGLVSLAKLPAVGEKIQITNIPPSGDHWVLCDGRRLDRRTHAALLSVVGTYFTTTTNTAYFNIPNYTETALSDMENYQDDAATFSFIKLSGEGGVPIGSIINIKIGPDNVEIDPKAIPVGLDL